MRDLLLLAAIALCGAACRPPQSAQIDHDANRESAAAKADADRDVIKLRCTNGATLAPGCGLLLAHVSTEAFRQDFRGKRCAELSTEQCQARFERDVDVTLRERYWAADRAYVARMCDAEPGRCDDPLAFEKDLLTSHNTRILIEASHRQMEIEAARNARQRVDQAEVQAHTDLLFELAAPRCRTHYGIIGGVTRDCF